MLLNDGEDVDETVILVYGLLFSRQICGGHGAFPSSCAPPPLAAQRSRLSPALVIITLYPSTGLWTKCYILVRRFVVWYTADSAARPDSPAIGG